MAVEQTKWQISVRHVRSAMSRVWREMYAVSNWFGARSVQLPMSVKCFMIGSIGRWASESSKGAWSIEANPCTREFHSNCSRIAENSFWAVARWMRFIAILIKLNADWCPNIYCRYFYRMYLFSALNVQIFDKWILTHISFAIAYKFCAKSI